MVVELAAVVGGKSRDAEFQFPALTRLKVPIAIDAYTLLHTTCSPLISSPNYSIMPVKRAGNIPLETHTTRARTAIVESGQEGECMPPETSHNLPRKCQKTSSKLQKLPFKTPSDPILTPPSHLNQITPSPNRKPEIHTVASHIPTTWSRVYIDQPPLLLWIHYFKMLNHNLQSILLSKCLHLSLPPRFLC